MPISSLDLATLSRLLDKALDIDIEAREVWLASLLGEEQHLAAKLRQMLADSGGRSSGFLSSLPVLEKASHPDESVVQPGELIGPYRLIREIGRGGMGTVWQAERADGAFKREVALKLPHLTWAVGLAKRMAREREIGAMLEHPNIARLYDAGVDERGRPYLAFEHIHGRPVDEWCRDKLSTVRQRVQLVVQLAHALSHAHARLVVHRDLKPANVLVTADGQAHLLDFGIAKLTNESDDNEGGRTHTQGRAMTLHYASPEQVRGEPIGVASDVYGLGVLTYELLTEARPFQPLRDTVGALEDAILAGDLIAASQRAPAAHAKVLRGDIDAILAKALQREATQRYLSVEAFADDLQRWLDGAPVLALPLSRIDHALKFLRRHRVGVSTTVAVAAVVLVAGGQVWSHSRQAELSLTQSQTANALLEHVFSGMSPDNRIEQRFSTRELLDSANQFLLLRKSPTPEVHRQTRWRMAELYEEIGAYDRAATIYLAAEATARAEGNADAVAESLLQLADVELKAENVEQARAALARLADKPRLGDMVRARAATLEGEALIGEGKLTEAIGKLRSGQALLASSGSDDALWWARATQGLGNTLRRDGQLQSARDQLLQSLVWQERREPPSLVDKLVVEGDLAVVESWSGDFRSAAARLERVQRGLSTRLGPLNGRSLVTATELAYAQLRMGRLDEARRQAEDLISTIGGAAELEWAREFMELVLARIVMYQGHSGLAVKLMRQRLVRIESEEGAGSVMSEPIRRLLGEALLRDGQTATAERVLRETEANQMRLSGDSHPSVATTRTLLAVVQARHGNVAAAHLLWSASRETLARHYGPAHPFALAAQAYSGLSAPTMSRAERAAIASRLQISTGWQRGTAELTRWLEEETPKVDWQRLPVVF
jgi:eukaryotic-like serine/threonine-protein kinase